MKALICVLLLPAVIVLSIMIALFVIMSGVALMGVLFRNVVKIAAIIICLVLILRSVINNFKK